MVKSAAVPPVVSGAMSGIRRALRRWSRERAGQSFIEIALAAPILVMGLIGGVDLMRLGAIHLGVQNAARVAAERVAVRPNSTQADLRALIDAELQPTPGYSQANLTVTYPSSSGGVYTGRYVGDPITQCSESRLQAGVRDLCYVTVEVSYTFRTLVPWWFVPNQVVIHGISVRSMLL